MISWVLSRRGNDNNWKDGLGGAVAGEGFGIGSCRTTIYDGDGFGAGAGFGSGSNFSNTRDSDLNVEGFGNIYLWQFKQ